MSSILRPSSVRPSNPGGGQFNQNPNQQARFAAPTFFLPTQLQRAGVRPAASAPSSTSSSTFPSTVPTQSGTIQPSTAGAAVISNKPVLYLPEKTEAKPAAAAALPVVMKAAPPIKKLKIEPKATAKPPGSLAAVCFLHKLHFKSRKIKKCNSFDSGWKWTFSAQSPVINGRLSNSQEYGE